MGHCVALSLMIAVLSPDHGKTTLVDKLFEFSGTALGQKGQERALDFNDLEKERGITIISKCVPLLGSRCVFFLECEGF